MFYINDVITNGFKLEFLSILSVIAIYCGILVITNKNPIVSVLFLITLFFNVACYLILIGLNFIGLSYLLVYVGAISILFLFILMLINIRISELLSQTRNSIPLVGIIACLIYVIINSTLPNNINNVKSIFESNVVNSEREISNVINNTLNENIHNISVFNWDGYLIELNTMASMGNIMFTSYPMWLIITSIILLLGMVGIIVITISPK
jgi:NADH-ubiquinone oxidoreductase chain 6